MCACVCVCLCTLRCGKVCCHFRVFGAMTPPHPDPGSAVHKNVNVQYVAQILMKFHTLGELLAPARAESLCLTVCFSCRVIQHNLQRFNLKFSVQIEYKLCCVSCVCFSTLKRCVSLQPCSFGRKSRELCSELDKIRTQKPLVQQNTFACWIYPNL